MPVDGCRLFCRDVGVGRPLVVLARRARLRPRLPAAGARPARGRLPPPLLRPARPRQIGRKASGPKTSRLRSEVDDLDRVRSYFGFDSVAVLGHSWGGVLAMEYAVHHSDRVSHLHPDGHRPGVGRRLASPAGARSPAGAPADDRGGDASRSQPPRRSGEATSRRRLPYYRIHFRMTLQRPELLEAVVRAAAVELHRRKASSSRARSSNGSTTRPPSRHALGPVPCAAEARRPDPAAARRARLHPGRAGRADRRRRSRARRLSVLPGCGHFTFLEAPELVFEEIARFCDAA